MSKPAAFFLSEDLMTRKPIDTAPPDNAFANGNRIYTRLLDKLAAGVLAHKGAPQNKAVSGV